MKRFNLLATIIAVTALLFGSLAPALAFATGVNANLTARVNGTFTGAPAFGSATFSFDQSAINQVAAGTSTGQADKIYAGTTTLAASATANLDLAGVLVDPLGATITFGHVKAVWIKARATNTNNFCIGGAASNGFLGWFADITDVVCIKPGGVFMIVDPGAGWAVTPSTGDLLKQANSAGSTSVIADIVIVGTST